jgi:hypothetical protein
MKKNEGDGGGGKAVALENEILRAIIFYLDYLLLY